VSGVDDRIDVQAPHILGRHLALVRLYFVQTVD
jgi:hypothetical protein